MVIHLQLNPTFFFKNSLSHQIFPDLLLILSLENRSNTVVLLLFFFVCCSPIFNQYVLIFQCKFCFAIWTKLLALLQQKLQEGSTAVSV